MPNSHEDRSVNRREFLNRSALQAAGVAAAACEFVQPAHASDVNSQIRLGIVGVRNRGLKLATQFANLNDAKVVAFCDVDHSKLSEAQLSFARQFGNQPQSTTSFAQLCERRDLDAIVIATPDHHHATMAAEAMLAGKDVYLEAPTTHTIAEGSQLAAVALHTKRIVQTGLHQRSDAHFQSAIETVRNGGIGEVHLAKAWACHQRKPIGRKRVASPPAEVDYASWLGPQQTTRFQPNRFHYNWRWFWDFGSGELGNWGVHLLDIARWGLGVEYPHRIVATGSRISPRDDQQTPDTLHVHFDYGTQLIQWEHRTWSSHGIDGRTAAVAFYGDNGTLIVDRSSWKIYDRKDGESAEARESLTPHLRNFLDSLKSRRTPAAALDQSQISSNLCHLGNAAYRFGPELKFDAKGLRVVGKRIEV